MWWKFYVLTHDNGKIRHAEIIPRTGRDKGT
jgi:hypothetical protein